MAGKFKNSKDRIDWLTELRSGAESIICEKPINSPDVTSLSMHDLQKLVHELRIHEIELSTQNQYLVETQQDLVESRDLYTELYDNAPVGYIRLNNKGIILSANLVMAGFLQVDRASLIGKRLSSFVAPEYQDHYYLNFRRQSGSLFKLTFDLKLIRKYGAEFDARIECSPPLDRGTDSCEFRLVVSDISDLKHIQTELAKSLRQLSLSLEAAEAGMWEWDVRTNVAYWSDKLWELFGIEFNSCEPCYAQWLKAVHLDDRSKVEEALEKVLREGSELNLEWRTNSVGGVSRWLMSRGKPIPDSSGSMTLYIGIVIDITDRKRTEEDLQKLVHDRSAKLRESEESFRLIFENSMDGIMLTTTDGEILRANPAACAMLGRTEEEICQLKRTRTVDSAAPRLDQLLKVTEQNGQAMGEANFLKADGSALPVEVTSQTFGPVGDDKRAVVCIRDISERKRMEKVIRDTEARFRSYFDLPLIGIAITSPNKGCLETNDALCDMLGYSRQELLGTTWDSLTHPDDLGEGVTRFERMLAGEINNYSMEKRFIRKDGSIVWTQLSVGSVRKPNSEVDYVVALLQNIDHRKQLEESLIRGKREWEETFDTVPDLIAIIDNENRIVRLNNALSDKFGIVSRDCVGRKYYESIYATDSPPSYCPHYKSLIDGRGHSAEIYVEAFQGHYLVTSSPLVNEDGTIASAVFVARDVSDLRRIQDELSLALKNLGDQKLGVETDLETRSTELLDSRKRFQTLFHAAQDYIFIKDMDLKYVDINLAGLQLLQLGEKDVIGRSDRELFGASIAQIWKNVESRVLKGQTLETQESFSWKGTKIELNVIRFPLVAGDGKIYGICGIAREVVRPDSPVNYRPITSGEYVSEAMRSTLESCFLAAHSKSTVLMTGETGSGKDYLAHHIHVIGSRANGPYYSINCATIPHELAESELFGHEQGAFTGAHRRKRGLLELAEGGTLLLNEIAELSLNMQSKLLAFLDSRSFTRLGGEKKIDVDIRLMAATGEDLWSEVSEGRFRKDLFYRLNVFPVRIPPLRDRLMDIPVLVENLLSQLAEELQLPCVPRINHQLIGSLMSYDWPGNVRELKNVLERAVILSRGKTIQQEHIALELPIGARNIHPEDSKSRKSCREIIDKAERSAIEEALLRSGGQKKGAARLLKMSRSTLLRHMVRLGLTGADGS